MLDTQRRITTRRLNLGRSMPHVLAFFELPVTSRTTSEAFRECDGECMDKTLG
jgi:hypothetical protein